MRRPAFIVNPYDEYGVEEAVQLVKQAGSGEVVIVTVGKESVLTTMRAALALGADRGILVKTVSPKLYIGCGLS